MEPAKILMYGYGPEQAEAIRAALAGALPPFRLLSAAGGKAERVDALLSSDGAAPFAESPVRVLLLSGFADDAVHAALAAFPSKGSGIPRPLFCVRTATNGDWTFETLVRHLHAERAEIAARAAAERERRAT